MSEEYSVLKKQVFELNDLKLVPIRFIDRYSIMNWRNEQIYHLRQTIVLSKEQQDKYFNNQIKEAFSSEKPENILFSFLTNDELLGYGGLVHIDWCSKNAEVSFLLKTSIKKNKKKYSFYFKNFIFLIKEVAFKELAFERIFSETYSIRKNQIQELEKVGFVFESVKKNSVFIDQDNKFYDSVFHSIINKDKI